MTENMRTYEVPPSAKTLIESMRDIGYTLETALADIIDNSLSAGALNIDILADFNDGEPRVAVLDDGAGLSEGELLEAMRPGSKSPLESRDATDLGRFGLGLKTASFSQCRHLTVISRTESTCAAVWDLNYVAAIDRWCVQLPTNIDEIPWSEQLGESGTLVLWQQMDRLLQDATKKQNREHFNRRLSDAMGHLELVFHRYLSGEQGLKAVSVSLNGTALKPRDPFARARSDAREVYSTGGHQVVMESFTLPHHSMVSDAEWRANEGRGGYLKSQGFYVYREKRLIVYGTWFGLARQTELMKLARVRIDIPNGVDAEWDIDVRKARAHPPLAIRERLRRIIDTIGASSTRTYRKRAVKLTTKNQLPVWERVVESGKIRYRVSEAHPVVAEFESALDDGQRRAFVRILALINASVPLDSLLADLGGEPEKVISLEVPSPDLRQIVEQTVTTLRAAGSDDETILEVIASAEPFRSQWSATENMLIDLGIGAEEE